VETSEGARSIRGLTWHLEGEEGELNLYGREVIPYVHGERKKDGPVQSTTVLDN